MEPSVRTDPPPYVRRETRGGTVTLTLDRGDRFNPLSSAMIAALETELDALAADESARVVLLAGAGRGFCAGHDLKELRAHSAGTVKLGGWIGVLTAIVAWYTSAAGVTNGMESRFRLPVGTAFGVKGLKS